MDESQEVQIAAGGPLDRVVQARLGGGPEGLEAVEERRAPEAGWSAPAGRTPGAV